MDFGPAPQTRPRENIVPMINVVFLLLIFFLMTAEIAPPPPVEVTPPRADAPAAGAEAGTVLHLAADGSLAYGAARGLAVFAALATRPRDAGPLRLRADAGVAASHVAALLPRLAAAGQDRVELVTVAR
ncbi:biopolymer transporter ExbD [Maritimibacter sp. 55A14]|uniref:ExbD/TolR family protein n=1 Tax=Maritimibacter sp. 55A14 TaxID=2174844 RepID=UPI000D605D6A|nr:biopolymer transporter ExbD [Maritimibacter sp. 55A14]PWE33258.1 biopolymer transporter ExbD [Maritimibacter sp. 55A14]